MPTATFITPEVAQHRSRFRASHFLLVLGAEVPTLGINHGVPRLPDF